VPQRDIYLLYAGRVDGRRLVVLQARLVDGRPAVALVSDRSRVGPGRLAVTRVSPIDASGPPAVALTDDSGAGVAVTRLLTAPAIVRVSERSVHGPPTPQRPAFITRAITDGLSAPWTSAAADGPLTAVRLISRDGTAQIGLLDASAGQPAPTRLALALPPPRWSGLPVHFASAALRDDALWFAQLCRSSRTRIELIWVGRAPGFPDALRLERVRCAGQTSARFVTGSGGSALTLAADADGDPPTAAYAAVVSPPSTLGRAYAVVVGSRRVASITVNGTRRGSRVAVVRVELAGGLRVLAANGTRIRLR
jgi:hypothetical protein